LSYSDSFACRTINITRSHTNDDIICLCELKDTHDGSRRIGGVLNRPLGSTVSIALRDRFNEFV
jgi:hypothetical protein